MFIFAKISICIMIYNIVNKTFSFVAKNWKTITTGVAVIIVAPVMAIKSQKRQNNKQRKVDEMNK